MKIYTKTGDHGETGLFGGTRLAKDDPRVEAYGGVDELNSQLGVVRTEVSEDRDAPIGSALAIIQSALFDVGAELGTTPERLSELDLPRVDQAAIDQVEAWIDAADAELAPLSSFVLPGGTALAAQLHVARTVCRRAERRVVALTHRSEVRLEVIRYLNRLSDLFFVWARLANHRAGVPDVPWVGRKKP
ncbi:MAG TPA: cob(I)yrinic acid a,c-diamide adenosyltransferase [Polyangiaceae bacterium LLY-WYZ-14_1]|nr:cob(I)yrinic acid a,c-diamide adenosyltransferase [Polyangiaceae bacterium LLY-WYZ-14_1]